MTPARYAVIPTRDRPDELAACLAAVAPQVDTTIVVDNRSTRAVQPTGKVWVVRCDGDPPNLSRLWNLGLELAADVAGELDQPEWDVAVLNDDAVVPPGWLPAVAAVLRDSGAAAGSSVPAGLLGEPLVHHQPGPVDLRLRLCGWAFVVRGETGLRADETLKWWYGDDTLDWTARQLGGTAIVPGYPVEHKHPNESTNRRPELAAQAGRDRDRFHAIWGQTPW